MLVFFIHKLEPNKKDQQKDQQIVGSLWDTLEQQETVMQEKSPQTLGLRAFMGSL